MDIFLTVLLIIFAIILLLIVFCLFVKIRIRLEVQKKDGEKLSRRISVEALGGVLKKNLSDFAGEEKKPGHKKEKSKTPLRKTKEESNLTFRQKISRYYQTFLKIKYTYSLSKHKIRKNIMIERLKLSISFGLDDAAKTGMATGAIWAGIYNAVAFAANLVRLTEPQIAVAPDFENEKTELEGECIIVFRLVNIISIILSIGINYLIITHKMKKLKNKEKAAINYGNTD